MLDYGSFANATAGGGPAPVPATLAYRVVWGQVMRRFHVDNPADGHSGDFMLAGAQMEWTATAGDYYFASAPLETSSSSFAEIGQEQNGIFFRPPGR